MKKLLMVSMSILLLTGCSDDQVIAPEVAENDKSQVVGNAELGESQDTTEDVNTQVQSLNLKSYKEYEILSDEIDLAVYRAELATNNAGKRILLFVDTDGTKVYKSIFSKYNSYLKIIRFEDDGLLYDGKVN